jgi:hypothetical protein
MAGTADNYVVEAVLIGPCKIYGDLGTGSGQWDGGAGVRLILHTDGSPDASQNPNAKPVGWTQDGAEWLVKPNVLNFTPDESLEPVISRVQAEEKVISGSAWEVGDMDLAEILMPTATRSDVMGSKGLTFGGSGVITYTSVAVIAPLEGDPTRFAVFHLYKAFNDQGLAAQLTSKKPTASPFAFRGQAIGTRAAGDRAGRYFITNAGAQS